MAASYYFKHSATILMRMDTKNISIVVFKILMRSYRYQDKNRYIVSFFGNVTENEMLDAALKTEKTQTLTTAMRRFNKMRRAINTGNIVFKTNIKAA